MGESQAALLVVTTGKRLGAIAPQRFSQLLYLKSVRRGIHKWNINPGLVRNAEKEPTRKGRSVYPVDSGQEYLTFKIKSLYQYRAWIVDLQSFIKERHQQQGMYSIFLQTKQRELMGERIELDRRNLSHTQPLLEAL